MGTDDYQSDFDDDWRWRPPMVPTCGCPCHMGGMKHVAPCCGPVAPLPAAGPEETTRG